MDKLSITEKGKKYIQIALSALLVYLGMKYVSPVVSPFLIAFLIASLVHLPVSWLHQKIKIRKSILAGLFLLLFFGIFLIIFWVLISLLWSGGKELAVQLPSLKKEFGVFLDSCCCNLENRFGVDGVVIENFILEQVDVLIENLEVKVLPAVMGKSFDCLKGIAGGVSFVVVTMIAVVLIMKDYGKLAERVRAEKDLEGVLLIGKKVLLYVKTFVRAQVVLLLIISGVCAVTLCLIGMKGGIVYGLITGFMDMLPFIGTGIMLMPLSLFMLVNGKVKQAVICLLLYAACALIREFLEPKLIGNKVGVSPVGILFAVFAGIKLFGIAGIIKGPLSLVIICEICRYLWNREEGGADGS
ncbi:MAG: AI-2E family transporter [Lachnospiraceae bacterium]|nr:AI-2E family transporter [Lachnospiraceae bacterium]